MHAYIMNLDMIEGTRRDGGEYVWDDRLEALFVQLSEQDYCTADTLAGCLNVSSKTVRARIKGLDEELRKYGACIEIKHGAGYRLHVLESSFYQELSLAKNAEQRAQYLVTSKNRVQFLLEYLLNCRGYVKMDDLCEYLYISRKTLTSDLKELEKILAAYRLNLVRKPNKGIKIEGDEFDVRLCMASLATVHENLGMNGSECMNECRKIEALTLYIQEIIQRYGIKISDVMFHNLIVHIYIALKRVEDEKYLPTESLPLAQYIGNKEYEAAKSIGDMLKQEFSLTFSETEINYIAIHLSGKQYLESSESNLVITQELSEIVTEMLDRVHEAFRFDFREDLELRMSLSQHIIPLSVRIQYRMSIENPMLKEIKERFPLAYAMAAHASTVLVQTYHMLLDENEIGYLALAFALALERQRTEYPKKNILLVCSSGQGSAKLLRYQYGELFGKYINRIETCDVGNLNQIDFKEFDYIFTTVPINRQVPIPVQEVKYFLEDKDVQTIRSYLAYGEDSLVHRYYNARLFLAHMKAQTKTDALREISDHVIRELGDLEGFYQAILEREELAPTAFGNMVAMPHPNYTVSEQSFVCVGILEQPVLWGSIPVQVIFLVSIGRKKDENLKLFYRITSEYLLQGSGIRELIEQRSYEGLIHDLQQIEIKLGKEGD